MAHPQKFWLVTALLAILTATLIGCNQVSTFEHEIQVRGADTDTPISNAVVIARMGTRDEVEAVSNADGKAQLVIDEKYHNAWVKVMVEAEGYQRQSVLVKLVDNAPPHIVQLQPPGAEPTSQPAVEATPSPTESNEQPPLDTGAMTPQADSSASELAAIPPANRANYYQAKPEITIDTTRNYQATIHTNKGDIVILLDAQAAPEHVNNFIFLSNEGFYDGLTFHRVEPGFVIQGGDPLGSGQGGPGYTVPGEFSLTHGEGAVAMARLSDDVNPNRESSGSQFYITLAPTPFLDGQYSVFGQVEEGMDVVQSIEIGDVIEGISIEP